MKFKKLISVTLSVIMILSVAIAANAAETTQSDSLAVTNAQQSGLYAHGVLDSAETEAWQLWQWNETENANYFYLPSGADSSKVELYNNSSMDIKIDDATIQSMSSLVMNYETGRTYTVTVNGEKSSLRFMKSSAEAAIYVNNSNADGNGTGLWEYLSADKSNSASATGAIVGRDGSVDNSAIKKIKGRGNTTWYKDKKPFNITYSSKVSIDGMEKGKKYSILANYQDASLARNRFLYDLSDAVGMPYASDSRFVDFYVDGVYKGSYQMAQKIDTGSGNLLSDIDETGYINADGSFAADFAFTCEVDAGAGEEDYYFDSASGNKITLKVPELAVGDTYYDNVLNYAKEKFDAMFNAIKNKVSNLDEYVDVESLTKIYLINELSKNWDAGVSSLYFTYKQDADGNWKFFASPVWDYDNSLGNATGVERELKNMGVTDYEEPTGWWCMHKGALRPTSKSSSNIMFNIARNTTVLEAAPQIWFEKFVPAINNFAGTDVSTGKFFSSDVYYNILKDSAEMNYTSGWSLYTSSWICDHSSLNLCHYDYRTNTYTQDTKSTYYDTNTFKGEYDYTVDWLLSRSAWLSAQMYANYKPSYILGDVDLDGKITIVDATEIQFYVAELSQLSDTSLLAADVSKDGKINIVDATEIQLQLAELA